MYENHLPPSKEWWRIVVYEFMYHKDYSAILVFKNAVVLSIRGHPIKLERYREKCGSFKYKL